MPRRHFAVCHHQVYYLSTTLWSSAETVFRRQPHNIPNKKKFSLANLFLISANHYPYYFKHKNLQS
jgi:hypothetical protein